MSFQCKICGQLFQKRSNRHLLKVHNLTPERYDTEYAGQSLVTKETMAENLLGGLRDLMATNKAIPPHLSKILDNITNDSEYKLRVAMAAMAWDSVGRLPALLRALTKIGEKMFSDDAIATAETRDLLKMWELASEEQARAADLIKTVSQMGPSIADSNLMFSTNSKAIPKDPQTRKLLGETINLLIQSMSHQETGVPDKPVPVAYTTPDTAKPDEPKSDVEPDAPVVIPDVPGSNLSDALKGG